MSDSDLSSLESARTLIMPTLTVQTARATLTLRSERIVVRLPSPEEGLPAPTHEVPWAEVDRIVVGEDVHLTAPLLAEALRREVAVCFVSWNGRMLGSLQPPAPPRGVTRSLQYARAADPVWILQAARRLVLTKLHNARRLLQRIDSNHHRLLPPDLGHLAALHDEAERAGDLDQLRGVEGSGAAAYYPLWARFLPAEFPFERRTTRPPGNAVNAVLSYLAALVHGELLTACHSRGLDPAPGALHALSDDRHALPLDLIEPFRPCVIDALALRLFSHRILNAGHFEGRDGGTFLNALGRRALLETYEQRLVRSFFSEQLGERTTLRARLQDAPLHWKVALADPTRFTPFLMN